MAGKGISYMSVESKQLSKLDAGMDTENFGKNQENQNFNPDKKIENPYSEVTKTPLTSEDRLKLQEETKWSDRIVESIRFKEEAEIYKNAGLVEREVNGVPCLTKSEINLSLNDKYGRANKERMSEGLPPLDKKGQQIELHHMGQKKDGPLVELTQQEHRGHPNDAILHDKNKDTEINRIEFSKVRSQHWNRRFNDME